MKAPVVLPDGEKIYPDKGTPQGGILSPLLSNIVLNELDWWVSSQWEDIPTHTVIKEGTSTTGAFSISLTIANNFLSRMPSVHICRMSLVWLTLSTSVTPMISVSFAGSGATL